MKKIIDHEPWFRVLEKSNPKMRTAILKNADDKLLCSICEVVANLFNGNIKLSASQLKTLRKHKTSLRKLYKHCCGKRLSKPVLRKNIVQSGGAFPLIFAALAPLIAKAALGGAVGAATGIATKKALGY